MCGDETGTACCCCCICLLILVTPITLLSLSFTTHNPKLYVQDLYIPALNGTATQSNDTRLNTFFFVELQLHNAMHLNGLRYKALNLTFYYAANRSFPVANYAVPGFYQGARKTAHKTAVVTTRGLPWDDAFDRLSRGLTVDLAVDLAATVKLRRCGAYMKTKVLLVAADVSFDGFGERVDKHAIRMH